MTPTKAFSVRQLRWLPALTRSGREFVNLDEVFTRAHEIRAIDTRDPIVRAALNRFLVTTGVLVARAAGVTKKTALSVASTGFQPEHVTAALDAIDDHLWLIHPDTPFLQLAQLEDLAAAAEKVASYAAELLPRTPGASGKVWFDAPGDVYNSRELTPEEAVIGLIAHWFYAPKSNKQIKQVIETIDDAGNPVERTLTWRVQGSIGVAGLETGRSLTFWHRGSNLAEFLMLNTAAYWLEEPSLPAWTAPHSTALHGDTLAGTTHSGSAALLEYNEQTGTFPTVIITGFPSGHDVNAAKLASKEQLVVSAAEDPTRVWQDKIISKTETERVLYAGFNLRHTTAQNLRHWFIEAGQPNIRHGLMLSRTRDLDVLALEANVSTGNHTITTAGWMSFIGSQLEADDTARDLITEIAQTTARRPEEKLASAIRVVFPPKGTPAKLPPQYVSANAAAVQNLHVALEPIFGTAVAAAMHGESTTDLLRQVKKATVDAFDAAMFPYRDARTFPDVARGRALLTGIPVSVIDPSDEPDPVHAFTGRFIVQSRADTRFRATLSRGLHRDAESQAELALRLGVCTDSERVGVTRSIGLLATHHRLRHSSGHSLGQALADLTRANQERFDGASGISARVALLRHLELDEAVPVLHGLVGRLAEADLGVSFYDVVTVARHWNHDDPDTRAAHRDQFVYSYFAHARYTPSKAAA